MPSQSHLVSQARICSCCCIAYTSFTLSLLWSKRASVVVAAQRAHRALHHFVTNLELLIKWKVKQLLLDQHMELNQHREVSQHKELSLLKELNLLKELSLLQELNQQAQHKGNELKPQEAEQVLPKKKRKPSRPPSDAWQHFTKVENDTRAACNYCHQTYACNTATHRTNNLLKHLKVCEKSPFREIDKKQRTLCFGKQSEDDNTVSFKLVEFNQEKTRIALAKMIIIDELPFKFVENQGFKDFMAEAQPRFKIPSRVTVARDCMLLYSLENYIVCCSHFELDCN